MPEQMTRRELARRGLLTAAALAVAPLAKAQETAPAPAPDPDLDRKVALIESKLAKPLSPEARELLKGAIPNNEGNAAARLKHTLPENSAPCFVFIPTPARRTR